jgi:hypothetical protein
MEARRMNVFLIKLQTTKNVPGERNFVPVQ